jgi:hypothetical protein
VFVDRLLDLIASEWNDEEIEAWLTSDNTEEVQQTNKRGDNKESDRETDNSTRTASSPKAADISTGIASPLKDDSAAITPNALSKSALKATLVPPNEFFMQGKSAEKPHYRLH